MRRRYSIKKLLLKVLQYLQETPVFEFLFDEVAELKACNVKEHLFLKKIGKRLLLENLITIHGKTDRIKQFFVLCLNRVKIEIPRKHIPVQSQK